ncbi:MAG: helix-turn-helix domain-containing protein [Waterburya sp.]
MPAPLRVKLSRLEEETLGELQKAQSVPYRTRSRAQMLKLNAQGRNAPEIAQIFNCHEHAVRATIQRWQERGLVGLWSAPGRGAKPKWKAEDLEYVEGSIELKYLDEAGFCLWSPVSYSYSQIGQQKCYCSDMNEIETQ